MAKVCVFNCPACGSFGMIDKNNLYGKIYIVEVEGHPVVCCTECGCIMDGKYVDENDLVASGQ
jgi:hypothetical protein